MLSDYKYTQAIWSAVPKTSGDRPSLQEDIEVDVAIIGAGITGVATAYFLKQSGKKVAVLESHKVGYGTTGSSTGNLYIPTSKFHRILKKHGQQALHDVVAARREALQFFETTIQQHSIDCNFKRVPWNYFSSEEGIATDKIADEREAIEAAGIEVFDDAPGNFPFPVSAIARVEMQCQFNPLQYVEQLAARIEDENCLIFEDTKVTGIKEGDPCILETANGNVRAGSVVQATHTPKGIYAVHAEMEAYREYAIAATIKGQLPTDGIYWHQDDTNLYSIRTYSTDLGSFLIVLDDSHPVGHKERTERSFMRVEKFLKSYFSVENIHYLWAAQHYKPADELPYIGNSPMQDRIYIATGFATDGLIWGVAAARIISDLINGIENPLASTFSPKRFTPSASFKRFATENINVMKHLFKEYVLKGDEKELQEVKRGEGKIVRIKGDRHAVHRDETGNLHIVTAVCPHLGCIVSWNSAEKSWDCPCHGSRFSLEGEVLEGPAIKDLEKFRGAVNPDNS
jgi:glycine/D-amino acid oxidase-like deaminating enzyme/nitrite reductase/ring-hydroxylating ferredoxin subunit